MSADNENHRDPRLRLVRDKYFSIRPRPLERWLWAQGIPASAERVFWLHWQEGVQRGDWCSEIPIRRVARECSLDVSTVTRAYQLLGKMGCIRRTDPGRDPANPFQQATALTEVRVPRELLLEIHRHPNRRGGGEKAKGQQGRAIKADVARSGCDEVEQELAVRTNEASAVKADAATQPSAASGGALENATRAADPFTGLTGRERAGALAKLTQAMSSSERREYQEAMRMHRTTMNFDADSNVTEEARAAVLRVLAVMAARPSTPGVQVCESTIKSGSHRARSLSVFEVARLRREIQNAGTGAGRPELLREVVWSVEMGALRRFKPLHAIHIALKKIREGAWTRPHRMPPNWMRGVGAGAGAGAETCGAA